MIPWEHIGSANVPGNDGGLHLYKRGEEFSIRVEGNELMNSRVHWSEDALAELACDRISGRKRPRLLIGGLGMGYTLAAALKQLKADGHIVICELVPEVVEWNHGPLAKLAGYPLQDRRVTIREVDVGLIMKKEQRAYDAILLDVDNGPSGLTRAGNNWLYAEAGLEAAFAALRPGGVLAVWSASPSRPFTKRLRRTGFKVDMVPVRSRSSRRGGHHTIWICVR